MQKKMLLGVLLPAIFGITTILPTGAVETLSPEDFKQESWSKTIDFFDYARSRALMEKRLHQRTGVLIFTWFI